MPHPSPAPRCHSFRQLLLAALALPTLGTAAAQAASVPLIWYEPATEARPLIFVNNPEEIRAEASYCDLADVLSPDGHPCARSLFRAKGIVGPHRAWWEHANKTNLALRYGIQARNPGPGDATIVIEGEGFLPNAITAGGSEFVSLFAQRNLRTLTIPAGESRRIFESAEIPAGNFFSGVVDFEVKGTPVTVDNLVWHVAPAGTALHTDLERRVVGNVHESLVYKGIAPHSEIIARGVNFAFDNNDHPGLLKVSHPLFTPRTNDGTCAPDRTPACRGNGGAFDGWLASTPTWVTHIVPDPNDPNPRRKRAVTSDIVELRVPHGTSDCATGSFSRDGCFLISPHYRWFLPDFNAWRFPNWGNWAVIYHLEGKLTNNGGRPRRVEIGVRADGDSPIAYRAADGQWRNKVLAKSGPELSDFFPYYTVTVPAHGMVAYRASMVLSGPGAGTFENLVRLAD